MTKATIMYRTIIYYMSSSPTPKQIEFFLCMWCRAKPEIVKFMLIKCSFSVLYDFVRAPYSVANTYFLLFFLTLNTP